jgi:hypothetical protein
MVVSRTSVFQRMPANSLWMLRSRPHYVTHKKRGSVSSPSAHPMRPPCVSTPSVWKPWVPAATAILCATRKFSSSKLFCWPVSASLKNAFLTFGSARAARPEMITDHFQRPSRPPSNCYLASHSIRRFHSPISLDQRTRRRQPFLHCGSDHLQQRVNRTTQ